MAKTRIAYSPANPERTCWGCEKYVRPTISPAAMARSGRRIPVNSSGATGSNGRRIVSSDRVRTRLRSPRRPAQQIRATSAGGNAGRRQERSFPSPACHRAHVRASAACARSDSTRMGDSRVPRAEPGEFVFVNHDQLGFPAARSRSPFSGRALTTDDETGFAGGVRAVRPLP